MVATEAQDASTKNGNRRSLDDAVPRKHRLGFQSEDPHGDVTRHARPGEPSCCGSSEIVEDLRAAICVGAGITLLLVQILGGG